MLLERLWLRDVKVIHDWGNNVIIVQGNGTVKTITINNKLGAEIRRPRVLVYYDLMEGLTNEKEVFISEIQLKLFSNWHNHYFKGNSFIVEYCSVKDQNQ
jgi:hypothetical protein